MSHTCTHIHLIICTHTHFLCVSSALPLFPQDISVKEGFGMWVVAGWGWTSSTSTFNIPSWNRKLASLSMNTSWRRRAERPLSPSPHLTSLVCSVKLKKPEWERKGGGAVVGGTPGVGLHSSVLQLFTDLRANTLFVQQVFITLPFGS